MSVHASNLKISAAELTETFVLIKTQYPTVSVLDLQISTDPGQMLHLISSPCLE
jgi:hypothetical protein